MLHGLVGDAGARNASQIATCVHSDAGSQDYPAWGYGLRYQYGMFFQRIRNGEQVWTMVVCARV
jgi:starch phosphorylase